MQWLEIELRAGTGSAEPAAAALTAAGSSGVSIVSPPDGASGESCLVRGYLPAGCRLPRILADLRGRLAILREYQIDVDDNPSLRALFEEDWANSWRAYFKPLRVGRRLVVRPSWEEYRPREGDQVIELDPGMAFGTGTHATTRLCLEALEARVNPGDRILDWGTGSGILALAAARLGAGPVRAVDTDPVAVAAARENVRRNQLQGRVEVLLSDLPARGRFDGIAANLLPEPITAASVALRRLLARDGWLIVSGISIARGGEVLASLQAAGFELGARSQREGWLCLEMR
jgi:ribosomal protein L11 methyltransferase